MEPFPVDPWLFLELLIFAILGVLAIAENAGKKPTGNRFHAPITSREPLHKKGAYDFYDLEAQARILQREGKAEKAKAKFLEAFSHVRDNLSRYNTRIFLMAGEWAPPEEAPKYYQMAADVSVNRHDSQGAVFALERAQEHCNRLGYKDAAKGIEGKIEEVKRAMPHNLEECFAELQRVLTPEQIEEFKSKKHLGELIGNYHMFLGKWMRNSWGLWHNSQLAEYFQEMGVREPDDMSTRILVGFYGHLNEESDDTRQGIQ